MISFVWSSKYPLLAGTGGSETYTIGQVNELNRRGIKARVVTIGLGKKDGRSSFPNTPFKDCTIEDLAKLDDTLVFVGLYEQLYKKGKLVPLKTKYPAYVIFHLPPPADMTLSEALNRLSDKKIIVPSNYAAKEWAKWLGTAPNKVHVVHPFAEHQFANNTYYPLAHTRPRVLYAGRLAPEKGVYTLLAALHFYGLNKFDLTVTDAGAHTPAGQVVKLLIKAHPRIKMVRAAKTREAMAQLIADHDLLVMPTGGTEWRETFGMLSVEAQHVGRRVVAMRNGGLPETDCGGLTIVNNEGNASALAKAIVDTHAKGYLTPSERARAIQMFTVEQSVDKLLAVINTSSSQSPTA